MRALKTHACTGSQKPSAGLSECQTGVIRHLEARNFSSGALSGASLAACTHGPVGQVRGQD